MRLKARANIQFGERAFKPEDLLDVPDEMAVALINRDLAMIWNLEDPAQRSDIPTAAAAPPEELPDVPPVTISPTSASALAAGSTGSRFDVTITGPGISGTWTVDKDASALWLTLVSPTTPQSTDGSVTYDVAENLGVLREAHFYVNGKTFTVTQDGVSTRSATSGHHGRH
jgi:hypothetical protein